MSVRHSFNYLMCTLRTRQVLAPYVGGWGYFPKFLFPRLGECRYKIATRGIFVACVTVFVGAPLLFRGMMSIYYAHACFYVVGVLS